MAGSSSRNFSWTEERSSVVLEQIWKVVRPPNGDPFLEDNIAMALYKLQEIRTSIWIHYVTCADIRSHLEECRQKYFRICELADHPSSLGFASVSNKIIMRAEQYESHIRAFPEDQELLNKTIPNFKKMFLLFGNGVMPGSRRRRVRRRRSNTNVSVNSSTTTGRSCTNSSTVDDDDDDDFMPIPRRGRSSQTSTHHRTTNHHQSSTNISTVDNNDDDDDFMPIPPRRHNSNIHDDDEDDDDEVEEYNRMSHNASADESTFIRPPIFEEYGRPLLKPSTYYPPWP